MSIDKNMFTKTVTIKKTRPKWQENLIGKTAVTHFGKAKIVDAGGTKTAGYDTRHVTVLWDTGVRENFYLTELLRVE